MEWVTEEDVGVQVYVAVLLYVVCATNLVQADESDITLG